MIQLCTHTQSVLWTITKGDIHPWIRKPFSSVQFGRCRVRLFATPWIAAGQLPEFTQTHVHRVGDAIHTSHPLSSPSPPAPNPSQHQGLFQWINSSHEVAKVLEFQLQHQSFQWTPRTDLLGWTGWISLQKTIIKWLNIIVSLLTWNFNSIGIHSKFASSEVNK